MHKYCMMYSVPIYSIYYTAISHPIIQSYILVGHGMYGKDHYMYKMQQNVHVRSRMHTHTTVNFFLREEIFSVIRDSTSQSETLLTTTGHT